MEIKYYKGEQLVDTPKLPILLNSKDIGEVDTYMDEIELIYKDDTLEVSNVNLAEIAEFTGYSVTYPKEIQIDYGDGRGEDYVYDGDILIEGLLEYDFDFNKQDLLRFLVHKNIIKIKNKMNKGTMFLHNHPKMEEKLGLDKDHVIVDRGAWEEARKQCNIVNVSDSLDLEELERKLDIALGKETKETLTEWLSRKRQ